MVRRGGVPPDGFRGGGPAVTAISLLAVVLLFAVPLYLLVTAVSDVRGS